MIHVAPLFGLNVDVGHHITRKLFGVTLNVDTIAASLIATAVVLGLGFALRAKATSGVPGKLQLFWEVIIEQVQEVVDSTIGPAGARVVPLAVTLFIFILVANLVEVVPTGARQDLLPAPTSDVNLPYALALIVIVLVHVASIRARGLRGYLRHYLQPFKLFLPINIIEEITKPVTLALRLFGNMFAGGLMVSLIALLPVFMVAPANPIWKLFDIFIAVIQAFIFALLTIIYFGMAMEVEH